MRARLILAMFAGAACGARGGDAHEPPESAAARAAETAAVADTSVQHFWTEFRRAALAGDVARVAALTSFPLRTRGPMDDDPEVTHDRVAFAALFRRLMAQDPGLAAAPETMRALLDRTHALGPRELSPEQARVGAFEFARTPVGWRLVFAYTEE